jgi:hypothetical protein
MSSAVWISVRRIATWINTKCQDGCWSDLTIKYFVLGSIWKAGDYLEAILKVFHEWRKFGAHRSAVVEVYLVIFRQFCAPTWRPVALTWNRPSPVRLRREALPAMLSVFAFSTILPSKAAPTVC